MSHVGNPKLSTASNREVHSDPELEEVEREFNELIATLRTDKDVAPQHDDMWTQEQIDDWYLKTEEALERAYKEAPHVDKANAHKIHADLLTTNNPEKAYVCYELAKNSFDKVGSKLGVAAVTQSQANIQRKAQHDNEEAEVLFREAENILEDVFKGQTSHTLLIKVKEERAENLRSLKRDKEADNLTKEVKDMKVITEKVKDAMKAKVKSENKGHKEFCDTAADLPKATVIIAKKTLDHMTDPPEEVEGSDETNNVELEIRTEATNAATIHEAGVLYSTSFHSSGTFKLMIKRNILDFKSDVIANSVGPKSSPTQNVLGSGSLAQKFASKCGKGLVDDMASSSRGTWTDGDLVVTPSYALNRGGGTPSHVVHFCLPSGYNGDHTYQLLRSSFERALNITHDMKDLSSIAFPFIGTGVRKYPPLEVMKALLDACSLFREKDSPLKTVSMLVWENDTKTEQLLAQSIPELRGYSPIGRGWKEIIPEVSDYSDTMAAFLKSMGKDRRVQNVKVLPVPMGHKLDKYLALKQQVAARNPDVEVERFVWHGTHGKSANSIVKEGFRIDLAGSFGGILVYGKGAYFARDSDSAHNYAKPGAHVPDSEAKSMSASQLAQRKKVHTMLLCKVITGRSCLGTSGMTKPLPGYDSAIDKLNDPRIFVIFNAAQILPVIIIEYCVG